MSARIAAALLGLAALPLDGAAGMPTCMRSWAEARARYPGYDHIVHLANGCSAVAECRVVTDVSPDAVGVQVDPGHEIEVLTFRGSPAATFRAEVSCRLEPPR